MKTRIIDEVDRGVRTVAGVDVRTVELVWTGGLRSFEVHRVDDGTDLTEAECFDEYPSADQIAALLAGEPAPTGRIGTLAAAAAAALAAATDPRQRAYLEGVRDARIAALLACEPAPTGRTGEPTPTGRIGEVADAAAASAAAVADPRQRAYLEGLRDALAWAGDPDRAAAGIAGLLSGIGTPAAGLVTP